VLFERICRKNGIKQLLAKPYSPITTGKAERCCGRSILTPAAPGVHGQALADLRTYMMRLKYPDAP
jgi:hypothetical protein